MTASTEQTAYVKQLSTAVIEKRLTSAFKEKGIIAYSKCCRRCKYMYEDDDDFELSDTPGIWFFMLFLQVKGAVRKVCCRYDSLDYVLGHREEQASLIYRWCKTVGVSNPRITWPTDQTKTIQVDFDPVILT